MLPRGLGLFHSTQVAVMSQEIAQGRQDQSHISNTFELLDE